MSNRTSGYHQKGTQELSEIRVQDVGHCQRWASFLSQRNCKVLSMEKNHGRCRNVEESPSCVNDQGLPSRLR